jgi:hypothetical protein
MKRKLEIEVECGETTCASEPGKFCRYARWKLDGSNPNCAMFGRNLYVGRDGWVQRCDECLSAEKVDG